MFPSSRKLEDSDKGALLRNFLLKMLIVVPLFHCSKYAEDYSKINNEAYEKVVFSFYDGTFEKGKELTKNECMRVFEPFWHHFFNKTVAPIGKLKLDAEELMAIIWLVFFDHGYTNISSHCVETCRNIKKVILRELKNYQSEGNHDEFRFIDTIETLKIIAKEEIRVMDAFLVYELYNVRIHNDFMAIVKEERY
ncbi:hypothetical protein GCK72_020190 [Caenorhabditis remanei]|uniref:NR LBD domain-containing protein n=1 Tax=Caenorhabditis remanei TaxID=31234 RepID=A0A6A5GG33_CAERE|nr:hypothetical protein GCK72_020190 [Caenorhabditis remanei]KAF1753633.1 hypothetical protein GCK72_020190 [Caenorhabditis remanei]